jgi:putative phosphoesterase
MPVVGVISDTHGLLRPAAVEALRGTDLILHAGDVGAPDVLSTLGQLAPVYAVCGNVDREPWTRHLPQSQVVEVDGQLIYVLHDFGQLDLDPAAAGFRVVVFGHSHRPTQSVKDGVLYLNPGSAGPRRFQLPVTAARLRVDGGNVDAQIIQLPL